jgi:hypothetical protein
MNNRFDTSNWRNKRGNAVQTEKKEINIRQVDLAVQKEIYQRLRDLYCLMYNVPQPNQGRWVNESQVDIKSTSII